MGRPSCIRERWVPICSSGSPGGPRLSSAAMDPQTVHVLESGPGWTQWKGWGPLEQTQL